MLGYLVIYIIYKLSYSVRYKTPCDCRRNVRNDLLFLYDLLEDNVDSIELLSIVGILNTREKQLFYFPIFTSNYS